MADFDFGGLLSNAFGGGGDSEIEKLLTAKQKEQLGLQSTLAAAAALLQAGGRSPQRIGLGQALGSALQAGQGAYEKGTTGAINQLMLGQKLKEAQQDLQFNQDIRSRLFPGLYRPTGATPAAQPSAFPGIEPATVGKTSAPTTSPLFSNLTEEQKLLVAFNPKAMLPKVFEESLKTDSFRPMTKAEAEEKGLDPRDVYNINTRTGEPKLLRKYEGFLGGGLQGNAYDILLSKEPNTPEYALAYRALSQPVPVEKVQPDGSVKIVYEIPAPLPASFSKPTYSGKLPAAKPAPSAAPGGAMPTPAVTGGPIDQSVIPGAGAKSTPYAPTASQVGEAKKQALTIEKLLASLNALEANVSTSGMQIGGMGAAGGTQEALFQDTILQLKELQNLGVLNGPDERILLQQLANPTQLSSYLKGYGGSEYVMSKITELKNKAARELQLINKQFPVPVTGQQTTIPTAPRVYTPPPAVNDLLKKYPGTGG